MTTEAWVWAWARGWRSSLRVRYTASATLLAALVFSLGGGIALRLYHDSLVSAVDGSGLQTAGAIAAGVRSGSLPDPIPVPVAVGVPRVQILGTAGTLLSGDPASVKDPPLLTLSAGEDQRVSSVTGSPYLPERHAALVAIRTAAPGGGSDTVVVAESLDAADARTRQAIEFSAAAGAGCLAMVAAVAWFAVGRTLGRVERLRAQVATVALGGELTRRVPAKGRDELAGLGGTLNEMFAALARSDERQRRFVADAAHELRTPIAGLHASIEVAVRHPDLARDGLWLRELRDGHGRLARLVEDLLVLASLDERAPRRSEPVALAGVVTDAAHHSARAGVRVEVVRLGSATVLGDETRLERVVGNLVDNAVRHAHSCVHLALDVEDDVAVITVGDDGPGIEPCDRDRVWERFTRLDHSRTRTAGGGGLGLALVKELVEAHGGTSQVGRAEIGGALFTVRIPLAGAADP